VNANGQKQRQARVQYTANVNGRLLPMRTDERPGKLMLVRNHFILVADRDSNQLVVFNYRRPKHAPSFRRPRNHIGIRFAATSCFHPDEQRDGHLCVTGDSGKQL